MKALRANLRDRFDDWFCARCQAFLHKRGLSGVKLVERAGTVYLIDRLGTYHKVQGLKP